MFTVAKIASNGKYFDKEHLDSVEELDNWMYERHGQNFNCVLSHDNGHMKFVQSTVDGFEKIFTIPKCELNAHPGGW